MNSLRKLETTSFSLHILAMAAMLLDHLWATVVPGNDWMNCVGRLAFPIFAFMLVEGYFHTRSVKKYALRLLIFALISEVPFNMAVGGQLFYPFHQNVMWTFLLALGLICWNEKAKASGKLWIRALTAIASILTAYLVGLITFIDYAQGGALTVLVFYFFRGQKWQYRLAQFLCLGYIHTQMLDGIGYELLLLGNPVFLPRQGLALLALIPIWLYRGRQGCHSKGLQYLYYGFYPAHLLILGLMIML